MDGKEGRYVFGFLLLGLAPLLVTAAGPGAGAIVFVAGLVIATSTAFV